MKGGSVASTQGTQFTLDLKDMGSYPARICVSKILLLFSKDRLQMLRDFKAANVKLRTTVYQSLPQFTRVYQSLPQFTTDIAFGFFFVAHERV